MNRFKRRHGNRPDNADRPEPEGEWPGTEAHNSSVADAAPPAQRRNLTCLCDTCTEHDGKPVSLPSGKASREVSRRGAGKGCRTVMVRTRVAL